MVSQTISIRTHLELGRISNLPTVISNVLLGVFLAVGTQLAPIHGILIFAGIAAYLGGMYLNDAFDVEFDRQWKKDRPIIQGKATQRRVILWGGGYLLLSLLLFYSFLFLTKGEGLFVAWIFPLFLVASILYYDWTHKKDPFAPVTMGFCRFFLVLSAYFVFSGGEGDTIVFAAMGLLFHVISLTYIARFESQEKYHWKRVMLILLLIPGITLIFSGSLTQSLNPFWWGTLIFYFSWVVFQLHHFKKKRIASAVVGLIATISLLDALWMGLSSTQGLLLGWGCFLLTLFFQRYISGT